MYAYGFGSSSVIVGRLWGDHLTVRVSQSGKRNAWQPVLNGHLQATDTGCRLVYRIGWHPLARVISIAWVPIIAVGVILNSAIAASRLVTGHASAAAKPATAVAGCVGVALFFAVIVAGNTWMSRDEAPCLRDWVTDHLQPEA